MRTSDVDILIIPGLGNADPDHWQTRWATKLKTARLLEPPGRDSPERGDWVGRIIAEVAVASRPVVFAAHSTGVSAAIHAAHRLPKGLVAGAFLVAAPDLEASNIWPSPIRRLAPVPRQPLPFPSVLVASITDPHCTLERASQFAAAWGSTLVDAGDVGHLDTTSGHGPWPEGLMRLGLFLKNLDAPFAAPSQ